MAVDPNIIMSGQPIDTATPLAALSQGIYNKNAADVAAAKAAEQQTYSRQQDAQKMAIEKEKLAIEKQKTEYDKASDVEKAQAKNAVEGAVRLSMMTSPEQITAHLNNPKNLHSESDLAKRDLWMKNPTLDNQEFKQYNASDIAVGQQMGIIKAPTAANGMAVKPIPQSIVKVQNELIGDLNMAASSKADLGNIIGAIDSGKLHLGLLENYISKGRQAVGISSENSRNYETFKNSLEKLRNDSLRLNKGVQTEGDSQRAWNEIMSNLTDENFVKQRLSEVQNINQRAMDLKVNQIDQVRSEYGHDPLDVSKYINVKPAILTGAQKTDLSAHSDQEILDMLK